MHTLSIEPEAAPDGSSFRVRVSGRLDRSAAYELRDRLLALKARHLTLDFSGVERCDDLALSVLAMWLADRRQHRVSFELVGLGEKTRNLFVSFGCNTAV